MFTTWRGVDVGDTIKSSKLFSFHRDNRGKIVKVWLGRFTPEDRVAFKRLINGRVHPWN